MHGLAISDVLDGGFYLHLNKKRDGRGERFSGRLLLLLKQGCRQLITRSLHQSRGRNEMAYLTFLMPKARVLVARAAQDFYN
jgi:hypothetical protein